MADDSLAALLLTNRLVDVGAQPLSASEFWSLIDRVPAPGVLLEPERVTSLVADGVLDVHEVPRLQSLLSAASAFAFEREQIEAQGIRLVSPFDDPFPRRLRTRLRNGCPSFLTAAGPVEWLGHAGIAVVGSADASPEALPIAVSAVQLAQQHQLTIICAMGGGVEATTMRAGFDRGARVVAIAPNGLAVAAADPAVRQRVHRGALCVASPYAPRAHTSAAGAIGRDRVVHALADVTFVVSVAVEADATWHGATEALQKGSGTIAVWLGAGAGSGNPALADLGAHPVTDLDQIIALCEAQRLRAAPASPVPDDPTRS